MKKRFISIAIFIIYITILIKVMVFKDVPLIRVGTLMLNFGGTATGEPNFVPFKTILPYLLGYKGWIIAGINLIGNIALLVPIGFLISIVNRKMTWKKSLALGVLSGFIIEVTQTLLHVGIFDIDDVILNALGVLIGYGILKIIENWIRSKKYKTLVFSIILIIASVTTLAYFLYPKDKPVNTVVGSLEDLCGDTGGIGTITKLGSKNLTILKKDGESLIVNITDKTNIRTPEGSSKTMKIGDKVTLVGNLNQDDIFDAEAIFVCSPGSGEEKKPQ